MAVTKRILDANPHPEQRFRSCLRVLRRTDAYTAERMEAAGALNANGSSLSLSQRRSTALCCYFGIGSDKLTAYASSIWNR